MLTARTFSILGAANLDTQLQTSVGPMFIRAKNLQIQVKSAGAVDAGPCWALKIETQSTEATFEKLPISDLPQATQQLLSEPAFA